MASSQDGDKRGTSPNSRRNLKPGSTPLYGERKRQIQLTLTPTAIEGAKNMAEQLGCASLSDFFEKIGRGEAKIEMEASGDAA
ncbi:MAG: hypothetical protein NVS2B14_19290 [Chamaesiphon sp.]